MCPTSNIIHKANCGAKRIWQRYSLFLSLYNIQGVPEYNAHSRDRLNIYMAGVRRGSGMGWGEDCALEQCVAKVRRTKHLFSGVLSAK